MSMMSETVHLLLFLVLHSQNLGGFWFHMTQVEVKKQFFCSIETSQVMNQLVAGELWTMFCTSIYFQSERVSLFAGGWWGCAPVTLAASSVALRGRSAVLSRSVLLQTSETIPSHTTLCWPWPLSPKYKNKHTQDAVTCASLSSSVKLVCIFWFPSFRFWLLDWSPPWKSGWPLPTVRYGSIHTHNRDHVVFVELTTIILHNGQNRWMNRMS